MNIFKKYLPAVTKFNSFVTIGTWTTDWTIGQIALTSTGITTLWNSLINMAQSVLSLMFDLMPYIIWALAVYMIIKLVTRYANSAKRK